MMLGAPGSSVIRPVVQTLREPATCGKRRSISASTRRSASPASRGAMLVVPAWFCSPVAVSRYCQIATIAVTTPIFRPEVSSVSPCSIWAST
jgi:hypothetical protein